MLNLKLALALGALVLTSCSMCPMHKQHNAAPAAQAAPGAQVSYVCPMHPQIVQPAPAKCPTCGMDLVAKK